MGPLIGAWTGGVDSGAFSPLDSPLPLTLSSPPRFLLRLRPAEDDALGGVGVAGDSTDPIFERTGAATEES